MTSKTLKQSFKSGISAKKPKMSTFSIILLLISSSVLALGSTTAAQQQPSNTVPAGVTPKYEVPSEAYLSIRPNPVGLGQTVLVNLWVMPAPGAHRKYLNHKVTITMPDGSQETVTMDSYVADGTAWFEWVVDKPGTWKFKFEFQGIYFPAGRYINGQVTTATTGGQNYADSVYVKPSATQEIAITVLSDYVAESWPPSPLPTDYWTRPVNTEHREWWPILGNYPWFGPGGGAEWDRLYPDTNPYYNPSYAFIPYVPGPNSAHIVWKRLYELGGIIGGDWGAASDIYWSPDWYIRPTVILAGRGYQTVTKTSPSGPSGQTYWQCYDIRTGEMYWERPLFAGESEPDIIEYAPSPYVFTCEAAGIEIATRPSKPYLLSIGGGYLRKYDPMTGVLVGNYSISPLTTGTYYRNGYVLSVQDLGATAGAQRYRLINWTTFYTYTNLTQRIISNTTYARSSLPSSGTTDWNVGIGCVVSSVDLGGSREGQRIESYDLVTGQLLWNKTIDEPQYSGASNVADHGKIAVLSAKGYYVAYDLRTGNLAWKTNKFDYPWDSAGWGSYSVISAYGKLYWTAQSGIYAINWANGKIEWKFEIQAPFPYETEYTGRNGTTVYPFHAPGLCADGKLYIYASEHSPETPYYRGLPLLCINATTGELVWKIGLSGAGQHTRTAMQLRIADGYLTLGARDGYMYVFGKGKSATTVTASPKVSVHGSKVLIEGSVRDMSPAQPGTPCVSKESMALQMEYLHNQMPINGIFGNETIIGVPVSLDAVDPNGNDVHIGDVITDGYSGTFGFSWQPEIPGDYKITATFMGDESYGSSFATTYITVTEAPQATATPESPQTPIDYTWTIIGMGIAIILAIAIVGVIIVKKR
ncbi:MAG: PQQ-binding-like beta-propeller repeat protein [Candidatus Bathyarchaeia archaeon]